MQEVGNDQMAKYQHKTGQAIIGSDSFERWGKCTLTNKNKDSMDKREQIIDLLNKCIIGESVANTADRILALFSVVGRSEQLCDHPRSERSYIGQNMLRCNKCGKEFS